MNTHTSNSSSQPLASTSSHADEPPRGSISPRMDSNTDVNTNIAVIDGKEYRFDSKGWARYSANELIDRNGYIRKMYSFERSMYIVYL